jgi:hypothetical protein
MSDVLQVLQSTLAVVEVKGGSAVTIEVGGVAGASGGGGSSKVSVTNLLLGTLVAGQSAYSWFTAPGICRRGLMSRLNVVADSGGLFDLQLRDAADGGGLWFEAVDCNGSGFDATAPVYIEGAASGALFLGIRNRASVQRTFYLANLRVEAFAS